MKLSDLNNLDMQDAANWPLPVKLGAAVIVFALIVAGGWYLDWRDQAATLERFAAKENELKQSFEVKQRRAVNLAAYEQQLVEMEASFGAMLRQLPSRADVPKLLVDISQTGLASGLEFELFKPEGEVKREFYAELPVSIRVRGNYHQFARFVSSVANLPRIVTLHNISIQEAAKSGGLAMDLTAKTYWYLDDAGATK
jgi:type IV pilus assembly protein PilO